MNRLIVSKYFNIMRIIDLGRLELKNINNIKPLKLVFKIVKRLLEIGMNKEVSVSKVDRVSEL